jgi:hypothetical protein
MLCDMREGERDYQPTMPSAPVVKMAVMSTSISSNQVGETRALALVPALPQPWYATAPTQSPDRREPEDEDEHTRILARPVGDHLPYELALCAGELCCAASAHGVTDLALQERVRGGGERTFTTAAVAACATSCRAQGLAPN